jgi:GT2 family glycosyltransferase
MTPIGWVGGTALMIRAATVAEIGALDEHIFMYGEDIEWCMRAHDHHWGVAIHNQATITHLQTQSSSSENALKGELLGYLYIWSKHKPFWQIPVARSILLLGIFLRIGIFSLLGKIARAKIYYRIFKAISNNNA